MVDVCPTSFGTSCNFKTRVAHVIKKYVINLVQLTSQALRYLDKENSSCYCSEYETARMVSQCMHIPKYSETSILGPSANR